MIDWVTPECVCVCVCACIESSDVRRDRKGCCLNLPFFSFFSRFIRNIVKLTIWVTFASWVSFTRRFGGSFLFLFFFSSFPLQKKTKKTKKFTSWSNYSRVVMTHTQGFYYTSLASKHHWSKYCTPYDYNKTRIEFLEKVSALADSPNSRSVDQIRCAGPRIMQRID